MVDRVARGLMVLGSRLSIVSIVITSIVVGVKSCANGVNTGTGGSGGSDVGGSGGSGGSGAGGGGGTGGSDTASLGGTGGTGGDVTSSGGSGGSGGCEPTFACGPKSCGLVDDGCGNILDCDLKDPNTGSPVTCASQNAGQDQGGPMTCGDAHTCECVPEGDSPAAMAFCEGPDAEPAVDAWCVEQGGCSTALCGLPPVPKVPESCIGSGQALKPDPDPSTWVHVWCCAAQ